MAVLGGRSRIWSRIWVSKPSVLVMFPSRQSSASRQVPVLGLVLFGHGTPGGWLLGGQKTAHCTARGKRKC